MEIAWCFIWLCFALFAGRAFPSSLDGTRKHRSKRCDADYHDAAGVGGSWQQALMAMSLTDPANAGPLRNVVTSIANRNAQIVTDPGILQMLGLQNLRAAPRLLHLGNGVHVGIPQGAVPAGGFASVLLGSQHSGGNRAATVDASDTDYNDYHPAQSKTTSSGQDTDSGDQDTVTTTKRPRPRLKLAPGDICERHRQCALGMRCVNCGLFDFKCCSMS